MVLEAMSEISFQWAKVNVLMGDSVSSGDCVGETTSLLFLMVVTA